MSQIEKQIANSLFDSNGTSSGASDCYKIAIDNMGKFVEWVSQNGWLKMKDKSEWVKIGGHGMPMRTTDQLIEKYLEHLETIK